MQGLTKNRKYKHETKEIALAVVKKKKNRARKEQRCCAKQHLMVAQQKKMPKGQEIQGRTKEDKIRAWEQYRKDIKCAKQWRRRRQAINCQIW